jgi:hypothetical protein
MIFVVDTPSVLGKYTTSQYSFKKSNSPFQSSPITKIPEENWEQKKIDVMNHNIDTFVMGDDWKGEFDL